MDRFVIISGCSGGGKSTLISELEQRGYCVVEEPGRRIISDERLTGGSALPWVDMAAFSRRAIKMALEDRVMAMAAKSWVFFDRGLIDAAAAFQHATGTAVLEDLAASHRYCETVFLAPPWPEIYAADPERKHGLTEAIAEYDRLCEIYPKLGYEITVLPKVTVKERADFVLNTLAA